ncbi:hypothetical protein [Aureicoccus marinus]|uniref:Uncharacterized protein n=1 Tax=Aureicoccus marinus TaxID=754435 RepID=A0A2S7T394_9FLAO|nr:hypothetical protein [Aureicoccus marinus]PQJ14390.1 hypothetical protein BST99_00275 [Aureicoccus marinus]
MLGIKRLLNFYLDASIHVALAVLALYWTSVYLLNILPNYLLAGFLFFSTIGYYNLVKYGGHLKVPAQMEPTSFVMIRTLTLVSLFLTMVFSVLIDSNCILFSASCLCWESFTLSLFFHRRRV